MFPPYFNHHFRSTEEVDHTRMYMRVRKVALLGASGLVAQRFNNA